MAAFTEGFTDTSQPGKDHIGALISRVIAARKFAREERELAEEKAKKAGYDSLEEIGVEKGFFFKAALKSKFGGSFISGKKQDIKQGIERVKLLKNPKANFWNFVDNRDAEGNKVKKMSEVERFRDQFDNYNFVSAKRPPEVSPDDPTIPNTEEETAKSASGRKGRVSREDILQAITAIAASLERTAQSINNNVQESRDIASGVHAIKNDVVAQLSERTDSIEAKLDAIIAAINAQTNLQKKSVDDAETQQDITQQKEVKNTADAFNFDDLSTKEDEAKQDDMQLDNSPAATSAQQAEFAQQDAYNQQPPQAETGGIISGPDEGYLAKLHGDEMVIPLDNNYTQGQPSAMDGKVRPVPETPAIKPKTQSFERGTASSSGMNKGSNLGGKIGFTPMNLGAITSAAGGDVDKLAQPLMDAMSLPMMVAGGTVLSSVTNMMNALGPENDDIAGEIAKVARPVADVFGLPNTLTNKATDPGKARNAGDKKQQDKKEKDKKEKKGLFGKVLDKISKLMGGGGAGGGGGGGEPPDAKNVPEGREDKIAAAVKFYKDKGLSDEGAAYMVGNLLQESGLRTDAVGDNGKAFGLAQWRIDEASGARWKAYLKWAEQNKKDPGDFYAQLEYTMVEGETYNKGLTALKGNDKAAIMRFIKGYEGYSEEGSRFGYGEDILRNIDRYRSGATPTRPDPSKPTRAGVPDSAQKITQNFGLKTHEKFFFTHKNDTYEAYKTANGFEIFKYGTKINTVGKNQDVVAALIKAGQERMKASVKPPSDPNKPAAAGTETASALKPVDKRSSSAATQVAMVNTSRGSRTSNTSQRPDSSTAIGEGGDNNLTPMYKPNGVVTA